MALRQGHEALESAPGGALRRSDPSGTGIRRRRCGRGFRYLGPDTAAITDPRMLARIKALVIPPAWEDVWICADPRAISRPSAPTRQAGASTGTTICGVSSGTRTSTTGSGSSAPPCRAYARSSRVTWKARGLGQDRVLAAAIRLIDLGFFRSGGEEYAEENGTFGLATIRKEHVTLAKGQLMFDYLAKGAKHREQAVAEDKVCAVVRSLLRRHGGGDQLLAYRSGPAGTMSPGRTSTTTSGRYPAVSTRPRTSAPGTRPFWPRWAWRCPSPRPEAKRPQARHRPRRPGGGGVPG